VDVLVDINRNDIKIHIGGGFWTDLASIFKVFFKGTVVDMIRTAVTTTLQTVLPAEFNKFILMNDGYFKLKPEFWLDWESPSAPVITTTSFDIPIKGLMFDHAIGE